MLAARLLVIHNPERGRQHDVPKLLRQRKVYRGAREGAAIIFKNSEMDGGDSFPD